MVRNIWHTKTNSRRSAGTATRAGIGIKKKSLKANQDHIIKAIQLKDHYDDLCCDVVHLNDEVSNRFRKIPNAVHDSLLDRLYSTSYKRTDIDATIYREYYSRLKQFAQAGWGKQFAKAATLEEFRAMESLQRNLARFAGHKVQTMQEELRSLKTLTKKDFKLQGNRVLNRHSKKYLQAEVQTASAAARSADKWRSVQKSKNLYPNLMYDTVGDDRVRQHHRSLDGAIRAIDDPFWDVFMPPNGYRCRCKVVQTDRPVTQGEEADFEVTAGFRHNPGKSGKVFEDDHPYFNTPERYATQIDKKAISLRADFDASDIRGAANRFVGSRFDLPQLPQPLQVNQQSIASVMASSHPQRATKDALLSLINVFVPLLRFRKLDQDTYYYSMTLFDEEYVWEIVKKNEGYFLSKILDLIPF